MAQLITKFGYLKDNKTRSRGGYAKYIATREGVESSGVEGYMEYMATRPRVEKQGSHGLFTGARQSVVLSQVAKELDAHRGNIWTAIYSLRREDAQRLGYDSASRWRDLLRAQAGKLAEGLKIAPSHLKWYAAFHNEGHHPHVHLIAYSTKPGEGFLTKQGMDIIRSALAQEIFRQDLVSVYERQTIHRDELRRVSREKVAGLVEQINRSGCENPQVEQLLRELRDDGRDAGKVCEKIRRAARRPQPAAQRQPAAGFIFLCINERKEPGGPPAPRCGQVPHGRSLR